MTHRECRDAGTEGGVSSGRILILAWALIIVAWLMLLHVLVGAAVLAVIELFIGVFALFFQDRWAA
jgi:hypothetical protein